MLQRGFMILVLGLLFLGAAAYSEPISIGVVEFEENNDIGLDNAGFIVADLVATEIARTEEYDLQERLLLKKVLEEQELMLSGIIDESRITEIGRIFDVDAIITGSMMKIGSGITVTGRLISVTSGKVLKTDSVTFASLDELPGEVRILANGLANIPREAFEIRQELALREWTRMEIGGGVEYSFNNSEFWNLGLNVIFRYVPPLFTLWVEGSPLPAYAYIDFGGTFNVTPFLGIGASYGMYFDNEIDYVDLSYVHLGFMVRPRLSFEFGLFIGGSLGGTVWTETDNKIPDIPGTWSFPANFNVWLLYKLNDNISIRVKYLGVELAPFDDIKPYYYPDPDYEYRSGKLMVSALYAFTVGGPSARPRP
jgi:hypothetical protein